MNTLLLPADACTLPTDATTSNASTAITMRSRIDSPSLVGLSPRRGLAGTTDGRSRGIGCSKRRSAEELATHCQPILLVEPVEESVLARIHAGRERTRAHAGLRTLADVPILL